MARSTGREGFQGSLTSGVEAAFYLQDDPVMGRRPARVTLSGLREGELKDGKARVGIVSMQTSKALGNAGTWSMVVKSTEDLRQLISDDDWVDLSFLRHGLKHHTMRGLVDEVRLLRGSSGGATTRIYRLSGRDFQKVFELTPIWFNRWTAENVVGALSYKMFVERAVEQDPPDVVERILLGFLEQLGNLGRSNWVLPDACPNGGGRPFVDVVNTNTAGYSRDTTVNPARKALAVNFMDPQGAGVWGLAREWADPQFAELWTDTVPPAGAPAGDEWTEAHPETAQLVVFYRDVPFPTTKLGKSSPWFSLPTVEVHAQDVDEYDVGKSGHERFNAVFVGQVGYQEWGQYLADLTAPYWQVDDVQQRGLRRLDYQTRYYSPGGGPLGMAEFQRERLGDWFALNPYLLQGSVSIRSGRPQVRVGSRLRLRGKTPQEQETFYVETVSNSWGFGTDVTTNCGVTRGWIGTDDSYLSVLRIAADRFSVAAKAAPGEYLV